MINVLIAVLVVTCAYILVKMKQQHVSILALKLTIETEVIRINDAVNNIFQSIEQEMHKKDEEILEELNIIRQNNLSLADRAKISRAKFNKE